METPATGRGTATMKIENVGGDIEGKDLIVDFVFKDQKSRTDFFKSDIDGRGPRVWAVAKSDKALLRVVPTEAHVERVELYDHSVGQDFHPETFFRVLGSESLVEWLETELETPGTNRDRSVELGNDGILHILLHVHYAFPERQEYDVEINISLDTKKGFVPVLIERKLSYADGSWNARQVKLQWAKFGSAWYVSAFEYNEPPSNHRHTVGTIKNFSYNVEVSDNEFTLDGMGIPDGMPVYDNISGTSYLYGTTDTLIEDLEKPLKDAEFVQKIHNQQSSLIDKTADANAQQTIPDQNLLTIEDDDSARPTAARSLLIAVVCVVALIGVVAFLGYRYGATR